MTVAILVLSIFAIGSLLAAFVYRSQREKARSSIEALRARAELDRDRIKRLEQANKDLNIELDEDDEAITKALGDDAILDSLDRLWLHQDDSSARVSS